MEKSLDERANEYIRRCTESPGISQKTLAECLEEFQKEIRDSFNPLIQSALNAVVYLDGFKIVENEKLKAYSKDAVNFSNDLHSDLNKVWEEQEIEDNGNGKAQSKDND